jgi:hypothetical protein
MSELEYAYSQLSYVCIQKVAQIESKRQKTRTWSVAAWQPRRVCYRPALFFRHFRLVVLSYTQGKIRRAFQKILFQIFKFFF